MKEQGIKFHDGVPDTLIENMVSKDGLLTLDDLMAEEGNYKQVWDLFTKHSDHQNVTVLYVFPPGKYAKSISRMPTTLLPSRIHEIN